MFAVASSRLRLRGIAVLCYLLLDERRCCDGDDGRMDDERERAVMIIIGSCLRVHCTDTI